MTGILPPAEPTAEEVYEATLDGLYNGEESGSVEAPTGWFALVQWPENELWYIVGEDNYGFKTLSGYGKDEAMARAAYAALDQEYGDWFGDNYDDAEHEVSSGE